MHKLAIVLSHPVQYYSPLFVKLAEELEVKVFYGFQPNAFQQGKQGFSKAFNWDIDLLKGYEFEFLQNDSKNPSSAYFAGCDTPKIGERLKNYGATHVVCFGWHLKMYRQALKYCKERMLPIAVRGDSQWEPNQSPIKKLIKKIYYPIFLNQFDVFLSVGLRNKEYLRRFGVAEKKIVFSPHAVDQEFWKGKILPTSRFTFIWVGKFIALKRPLDAIKAFQILQQKYPDISLKMVGSGRLLDESKEAAKENKSIQFLGFKNQKELRDEYLSSDALILSSDSETWGLVVNEGFAAGIPAIVSSICGCSPDLINSQTGRTYPTGDVLQLSRAMEELMLISDKESIRAAIELKNKLYSFDRNVSSFKQFLNLNG